MDAEEIKARLEALGVGPEELKVLLAPVIADVMKGELVELVKGQLKEMLQPVLAGIPQLVQAQVKQQADQLAGAIASQVQQNGKDVEGGLREKLLERILSGAAASGGGGMEQLASTVKGLESIFSSIVAPMMNIFNQGRMAALQELTLLARSGAAMPWEQQPSPAQGQGASMGQGEGVREVAKRIVVFPEGKV